MANKFRFCDVQCFAGGFTVGAVQAGFELVAKREGVGGFGVPACESNRHILGNNWQTEARLPATWTPVETEAIFSNPPCSGFSLRSIHVPLKGTDKKKTPVSEWTNGFRGVNSPINSCMHDIIEYGAKCSGIQVIVFESVQQAGKQGLPLMRELRNKLEHLTNKQWDLHHVFHNNLSVGGVCNRPRYFWVASQVPFGVLPAVCRNPILAANEVLQSNLLGIDGNQTPNTMEARRIKSLLETGIEMLPRETISQPAGRFVQKYGIDAIKKLDAWDSSRLNYFANRGFRPDQYQPRRMDGTCPPGVITGKIQESISPTEARCVTFREALRVLGFPENWKAEAYKTDAWIAKGIPVASGKYIAESVKLSLEGNTKDLISGKLIGDREWEYDNTHAWKMK
jgi:site-specific DNA-cytosine methylase